MIGFLVTLLVLLIVFGVVFWLVSLIPMPPPLKTGAQVVVGLIAVIVLLGLLFGWVPLPYSHHVWMR